MCYRIFEPMLDSYERRPFQGQVIENAKVFIFGIDPNYDNNMSEEFLDILKKYHENGVAYWLNNWQNNNNNDHHPFLLPEYRQAAGYLYHLIFKMTNLPADRCAEAISFVELLNVPTAGDRRKDPDNLFMDLLQRSIRNGHIERLQNAMLNAHNKLIFMPDEVIKKLKKINSEHGLFAEIDYAYRPARGLPVIYNNPEKNITIRKYLHPAAWQCNDVLAQLPIMRQRILEFLDAL